MKKISLIACSLFCAIILIAAVKRDSSPTVHSLEGVWELKHQYIFEDNKILDTLYDLNGERQVKMYSRGKVMWSRFNPKDGNEWFGYGTYKISGDFLEEHLEYASNAMMKIVDTVDVFRFVLEFENDNYSQISLDENGNKYNSENYVRLE